MALWSCSGSRASLLQNYSNESIDQTIKPTFPLSLLWYPRQLWLHQVFPDKKQIQRENCGHHSLFCIFCCFVENTSHIWMLGCWRMHRKYPNLWKIKYLFTCIAMEILSRSLRISCRFFVPKIFLKDVWARSLCNHKIVLFYIDFVLVSCPTIKA